MSAIQKVQIAPLVSGVDQNHPNPFNPQTTIHYTLATPGRVTLTVYDATGRLVRTLLDENQPAGARDVTWNGQDDRGHAVASGVYFYKMTAGKFTQTKRMVLLK
jgi:flagellar hook assembly protein FlgD